jgi:hypothetical protein
MTRLIPVVSDELQALVDEHARRTGDQSLALTALYLRAGLDDFLADSALMLDVIRSQFGALQDNAHLVSERIEKVEFRLAHMGMSDVIASLELQLAFARRLAEYLQKDIDQAERDARGEGVAR